jgi:hypothetical protein
MTAAEPTEPPTDGPAVEQPPHAPDDRPRVTVYPYPGPGLWIYTDRWRYASARSRQDYRDGRVVYRVEIDEPNPDGTTSRCTRAYPWGKDNIRPA